VDVSNAAAGMVTALHYRQLVVRIGEAGSALMFGLGEGGVGGFADGLHGTGTKSFQGFKDNCTKRVSQTMLVEQLAASSARRTCVGN
jgi:hypothetical protein